MQNAEVLPASEVAEIAALFDLDPEGSLVRENADHARRQHGEVRTGYNGDARVYWDTDPATGRVDAAMLLAGWLQEEARCIDAETREAQDFERNAYGIDD